MDAHDSLGPLMRSLATPGAGLSIPAIAVLTGLLTAVCAHRSNADVLLVPEDHPIEEALAIAQPGDEISLADGALDGGTVSLVDGIRFVSRTPRANRVELLRLIGLSDGVEVVGLLVGYDESDHGEFHEYDQGVWVWGSRATFTDCHFERILPCTSYFYGCYPNPPQSLVPIRCSRDSKATFTRCFFTQNLMGSNMHGEAIAAQCVASFGDDPPTGLLLFEECLFDDQPSPIAATMPVEVQGCQFLNGYTYVITALAGLVMERSLVASWTVTEITDCLGSCYGTTPAIRVGSRVQFHENTLVDTRYEDDPYCDGCPPFAPEELDAVLEVAPGTMGSVTHNLFIGQPGAAIQAEPDLIVGCNDTFQSADVNYRGGIGDVTGTDGNISEAPIFCDRANGDYTISIHSPVAAENSACGQMGAFGTACDALAAAPSNWGALKGRFQKKRP